MGTWLDGYNPSDYGRILKERNGDIPSRVSREEARLKSYVPNEMHLKKWTDKGGAKDDFIRMFGLDGDRTYGGISYKDILIYESMMKNQSNGIVSDLNTKLLMEYKKEYEAEFRAQAEAAGFIGKEPVKNDPRQPKDSPTPINDSSPLSSTPIQGTTFNLKI